jgi:hypothetical protein
MILFALFRRYQGFRLRETNDFFAQFSIFGAPFEKIAVYLDDVLVQQPFHGIPNEPQGASLSVLNGETVDELKLMPAVFPARYGDATGAALAIHTREGSRSKQTFRISSGLAYSNFTGEGALGHSNRGSWLMTARKSYLGYLVRRSVGDDVADVSFADGSGKLVYDVTKRQHAELYVIGGHADLSHAAPLSSINPNDLESGGNDFTLARAGWRFAATPDLLITTHTAYIRQRYDTENPFHNKLRADYYGEWLGGAEALWNWSKQQQSEAGWTLRRLRDNRYAIFYSGNGGALASSNDGAALRESGYMHPACSGIESACPEVCAGIISKVWLQLSPHRRLPFRCVGLPRPSCSLGLAVMLSFPTSAQSCRPVDELLHSSNAPTITPPRWSSELAIGRGFELKRSTAKTAICWVSAHLIPSLNAVRCAVPRSLPQVSCAITRAEFSSCSSAAARIGSLAGLATPSLTPANVLNLSPYIQRPRMINAIQLMRSPAIGSVPA